MQTLKTIYGLKQSPRAWSETEARVELLCSIMIWKRNPGKKREKKKEFLRALFERYWRRSQKRIPAESDIHRNIEDPTNIPFTQQHTLLTHSLIKK